MSAKQHIESISIIGTGNMAYHLSHVFYSKGLKIMQIYGRNPEKARMLAQKVNALPVSDIKDLDEAGIYFFCLTDQGLTEMLPEINFGQKLCVHVSGSLSLDHIRSLSANTGVFYPLQTFSSDRKIDYSNIPVCIEANTGENLSILRHLGSLMSNDVRVINSGQRITLHIAAVFASNFSNHMYHIAEQILSDHSLDFSILHPLIEETSRKALNHKPGEVQTGPAKRNDLNIIDTHLNILSKHPDYQKLYKVITKNIQDHFIK